MSPSILQIQTQAGNGTKPIPIGPNPKSRSNESITTLSSSTGSSSPKVSLDIVRCSRCQRSLSIDPSTSISNQAAVRFGLNSYYCSRCANVVGFVKWKQTEGYDEHKEPSSTWNSDIHGCSCPLVLLATRSGTKVPPIVKEGLRLEANTALSKPFG